MQRGRFSRPRRVVFVVGAQSARRRGIESGQTRARAGAPAAGLGRAAREDAGRAARRSRKRQPFRSIDTAPERTARRAAPGFDRDLALDGGPADDGAANRPGAAGDRPNRAFPACAEAAPACQRPPNHAVSPPMTIRPRGRIGEEPESQSSHERNARKRAAILSDQAAAALCVRRGERDEGGGARRRRRHHRFRHGQPGPPLAAACRGQADRSGAGPEDPSLFQLARHSRAEAGDRGLLRAPLRGHARPRPGSHRHPRLQGGLRQSGDGDHQPGRRGDRPQPVLSDPRLRLHHRRWRAAPRPRRPRYRLHGRDRARGALQRAGAAGRDPELSGQPDRACRGSRVLRGGRRFLPQARDLRDIGPRLCGGLFRRQPAAVDPAGSRRDRHRGRVHLAQQDLFDAGLADRLRGRQPQADRGAGAGKILSRLRRVHPGPGRRGGSAQRPAGVHRRDPRALSPAPGRAGREFRRRRVGDPAALRDHVRLGADPAPVLQYRLAGVLETPAGGGEGRGLPGVGFGEYGEGHVRIALVENRHRIRQAARNVRRFLADTDRLVAAPNQSAEA